MTEKRFILKYLPYETDNGEIIEADPYYIDKEEEYVDEEDYFTIDGYPTMSDKQVVDLLNELSEENEQLKIQLQNTSAQRDEFHHGARENANRVGKLKKENEQLKKELESFEQVSFTDLCDGSRTTLYMKKENGDSE